MGSFIGRRNQYIQLAKVLYCKLPTNGKQLPAFSLEVGQEFELRSQRWEARVLPLCQCSPRVGLIDLQYQSSVHVCLLLKNILKIKIVLFDTSMQKICTICSVNEFRSANFGFKFSFGTSIKYCFAQKSILAPKYDHHTLSKNTCFVFQELYFQYIHVLKATHKMILEKKSW